MKEQNDNASQYQQSERKSPAGLSHLLVYALSTRPSINWFFLADQSVPMADSWRQPSGCPSAPSASSPSPSPDITMVDSPATPAGLSSGELQPLPSSAFHSDIRSRRTYQRTELPVCKEQGACPMKQVLYFTVGEMQIRMVIELNLVLIHVKDFSFWSNVRWSFVHPGFFWHSTS